MEGAGANVIAPELCGRGVVIATEPWRRGVVIATEPWRRGVVIATEPWRRGDVIAMEPWGSCWRSGPVGLGDFTLKQEDIYMNLNATKRPFGHSDDSVRKQWKSRKIM